MIIKQPLFTTILVTFLLFCVSCKPEHQTNNQQAEDLVIPDTVFASKTDSLEWVLTIGNDMQKMNAYLQLSSHYSTFNKTLSQQYALELLHLAQHSKDSKMEGFAYRNLATIYFNESRYDSALFYRYKSLEIFEKINEEMMAVTTKLNIALSLSKINKFDEAVEIMHECLDYYTKNNMSFYKGATLQSLANLYTDIKMYDLSNEYYFQSLSILETLDNDVAKKRQIGISYINIGQNFIWKAENEKGLEYKRKALEIFREINDVRWIIHSLKGCNYCNLQLGRFEEAEKDLIELEYLVEKTDNIILRIDLLQAKYSYFFEKKDYKQGFEYAKQTLALIDTADTQGFNSVYRDLTILASHVGTPDEWFDYFVKYENSTKEIFHEEWSTKLTEMEIKYDIAKKNLEIEQHQNTIRRQIFQRWLLLGGITVALAVLIMLWYMLRLRNCRNQALTESAKALSERNTALAERTDLLAEMNATKDKFFSIISHDLRNPALALRDALQLLVDNADLWNADTIKRYYHQLLDTADDQVELLYNLLNWAQMQTGRMTYMPAPFDLAANLRHDLSLIRNMAEKKGVTLAVEMPTSAIITGDRHMLATVVRNLLTNAVKFTPAGGTVTLEIYSNGSHSCEGRNLVDYLLRQDAGATQGEGAHTGVPLPSNPLSIVISDTGVGMTDAQLRDLFHIDRKQSLRGTAGEQGTGLGLVVSKELLDKHGISLQVESDPGQGSRFWFTIL